MATTDPPDDVGTVAATEQDDIYGELTRPATLAPWIRMQLESQGWEPAELARQASLDQRSLERLLKNGFPEVPTQHAFNYLRKIARALNVSYDEVAERVGYPWSGSTGPESHEDFGRYLLHLMLLKEMAAGSLASEARMTPDTIGGYLKGRIPSSERFERIADALDIDPTDAEHAKSKYGISAKAAKSSPSVPKYISEALPYPNLDPENRSQLQLEALKHRKTVNEWIDSLRGRDVRNARQVVFAGLGAALLERQPGEGEDSEIYKKYVRDRVREHIAKYDAEREGVEGVRRYLTRRAKAITEARRGLPASLRRDPRHRDVGRALGLSTRWVMDTEHAHLALLSPGATQTARNMPSPPQRRKPPHPPSASPM